MIKTDLKNGRACFKIAHYRIKGFLKNVPVNKDILSVAAQPFGKIEE